MHRRVGISVASRLDAGTELGLAEGQHVQRGARRCDASAAHELDLRSALEELFAHPQTNLVRAVGDIGGARLLHEAQWTARTPRQIGQRRIVAVAAGRRDHGAGRIDARPGREPVVDCLLQREGRAAEIPDGGKAAHQRSLGLCARGKEDIAYVRRQQRGDRKRREDRMPMGVDQARHQDAPAAIDHPRAVRRRRIAAGDLLDAIALDKEAKASSQNF